MRKVILLVLIALMLFAFAAPSQASPLLKCTGLTKAPGKITAINALPGTPFRILTVEVSGLTDTIATARLFYVGQNVKVNATICEGVLSISRIP